MFRADRALPPARRRGPHEAFSGAWSAVEVVADHAPEKAHARPEEPGRSAASAPRVTGAEAQETRDGENGETGDGRRETVRRKTADGRRRSEHQRALDRDDASEH